ncbi:hypothetical protein [Microbacterium sp. NFH-22A-Y]|uniref:hypothetical protein n=1 Tax=Microbacterium sp. NFH-22A-Y TaxID=2744448 RepID=UPI001F2528AE|nr:hypothetical protein [Microbacterium sp. NFH-22A-Y]
MTVVDEFNTAACARCSRSNDQHFRSMVAALQAEDFTDRHTRAVLQELPAHSATVEAWLVDVDEETLAMVGMRHDQLPSWYWADAHAAGLSAHEAAHFAFEDAHRDAIIDGWYLARYAEAVAEGGEDDD